MNFKLVSFQALSVLMISLLKLNQLLMQQSKTLAQCYQSKTSLHLSYSFTSTILTVDFLKM